MVASLYDNGRNQFLQGNISWTGDTFKVLLLDTGNYSVNLATHNTLANVTTGSWHAASAAITGKTASAGIADGADLTVDAVTGIATSTNQINALVIYADVAKDVAAGGQVLIAYIDTGGTTGLPITPNGGNISITWDNTTNKIFKL
jgi:hypothetical protein